MNIHSSLSTIGQIAKLVVLAVICLAVGLFLAQIFTNVEVQDALQYRRNLQSGDYDRQGEFGIWPVIVVVTNAYIWEQDPFIFIGGVTAAIFLFNSIKARVGWARWAIFLVLLVMPLMVLNYVQVLRQGLAVAIIIAALMANSFVIMSSLLMLAAMLHSVYAPFIALALLRFSLFPSSTFENRGEIINRHARRFDWAVFIVTPLAFVVLMYFAPEPIIQKYFEFDIENVKRILVSMLVIAVIALVYPVSNQRIAVFTAYFGFAVAISLPFQNDYTRINTAIFPLLVFAALLCERPRRSYYALAICFLLTLYISLRLEYS